MQAPLPPDETDRLRALWSCHVLDTGPDQIFDDLTRLAARLVGTPIALVSLVDAERQWFKSRVGLDVIETPRDRAICAHALLAAGTLVVPDTHLDPRFADNPLVTGPPFIRFYAGEPLHVDGRAVGTLCCIDTRPRQLTAPQQADLVALGRQAAAHLRLLAAVAAHGAARQAAEAATLAKSRFVANMSHEIRTPLAAILGYAEMLQEPDVGETDRRDGLAAIRRSGAHLLDLINDVLEMTRTQEGRLPIERRPCDAGAEVRAAADMVRRQAAAKHVRLACRIDPGVPALVSADATRLRQVALNLLGNALKFTPRGEVSADLTWTEPDLLTLAVRDTGIGIAPAALAALFEPFQQADDSTARRFGGSGLGLAISRGICRAMGGDLVARSQPDAGSTFTATFACPRTVSADTGAEAGRAGPPDPRLAARILLADDGEDNRRLLSHFLRRAGAAVTLAENGAEAIEAAFAPSHRSPAFDLIILDMQMPLVDGYAAARDLRQRGYAGPILALTAHGQSEDRARCLAAGCTEYLAKPVARARLLGACADLLAPARAAAGVRPAA